MSNKRKPAPSHRIILNSWFNRKGAEVMLGWECFDNIAECTNGHWNCWACGIPKKEKSLEKCHIIPHALGGGNDPLNYFLMCGDCHAESPDTKYNDIFISWAANKNSYTDELINQIYETLNRYPVKQNCESFVIESFNTEMKGVGSHGGKLARSSTLGILGHVCGKVSHERT